MTVEEQAREAQVVANEVMDAFNRNTDRLKDAGVTAAEGWSIVMNALEYVTATIVTNMAVATKMPLQTAIGIFQSNLAEYWGEMTDEKLAEVRAEMEAAEALEGGKLH